MPVLPKMPSTPTRAQTPAPTAASVSSKGTPRPTQHHTSYINLRQDRFRAAFIAYFRTEISASGSGIVIWPMFSSPA